MNAVQTEVWQEILRDVGSAVEEPTWDLIAYCRFLAGRLPEVGSLTAADLARLAEELVADLKEGIDRRTGQTFEPPLVSGRSDLLYNYCRSKLALAAKQAGGEEYARALAAELRPVTTAPPAPAAEAKAEAKSEAPAS